MIRIRDPRYAIHYSLSRGEMVAFDNRRVLHGRTAFDAESGDRHFHGYYIEQNEIDSRIRVLSGHYPGGTPCP
jgi:gamma-butyrobetaine dioxygenase